MFRDMTGDGRGTAPNAVWDGRAIQLFGALGETVSYQLVIDRVDLKQPLTNVTVSLGDLTGSGGRIGGDIELFKTGTRRTRLDSGSRPTPFPGPAGERSRFRTGSATSATRAINRCTLMCTFRSAHEPELTRAPSPLRPAETRRCCRSRCA